MLQLEEKELPVTDCNGYIKYMVMLVSWLHGSQASFSVRNEK